MALGLCRYRYGTDTLAATCDVLQRYVSHSHQLVMSTDHERLRL